MVFRLPFPISPARVPAPPNPRPYLGMKALRVTDNPAVPTKIYLRFAHKNLLRMTIIGKVNLHYSSGHSRYCGKVKKWGNRENAEGTSSGHPRPGLSWSQLWQKGGFPAACCNGWHWAVPGCVSSDELFECGNQTPPCCSHPCVIAPTDSPPLTQL